MQQNLDHFLLEVDAFDGKIVKNFNGTASYLAD